MIIYTHEKLDKAKKQIMKLGTYMYTSLKGQRNDSL